MNLLVSKAYSFFCWFYSGLISLCEGFFLKIDIEEKSALDTFGFQQIVKDTFPGVSRTKFDFVFDECSEIFNVNNFHKRVILSKDNLKAVIEQIFDKEFCAFLTAQTGFKYSIDFFGAYMNLPLPYEERNQPFYANSFHLDKPNSKNMLKLFIPMADIGLEDGPLEILSLSNTRNVFNKRKKIASSDITYLICSMGDIFMCRLNKCLHKAGIPEKDKCTKLIMIQLNPSFRWYISSKLYKRQYLTEPKFTSLLNQFQRRRLLLFNK